MMIAGIRLGLLTSSCSPLYAPNLTSAMSRSGVSVRNARSPSSNDASARVWYPALASSSVRPFRVAESSSTISTLADIDNIPASISGWNTCSAEEAREGAPVSSAQDHFISGNAFIDAGSGGVAGAALLSAESQCQQD